MRKILATIYIAISIISFGGFEPYQKEIGLLQDFMSKKEFSKVDSMAVILFGKMPKDSLKLKAYLFLAIGRDYNGRGHTEEAKKYFLKSIDFQYKNKTEALLVDAHLELGVLYYHTEMISEAMNQYKLSLEYSIKFKDRFGVALSYNNIGLIFMYTSSYEEAQKYFDKSLEYMSDGQDELEAAIYTNLGIINYFLEKYQISLNHLDKAEQIIRTTEDGINDFALANVYLNKALNEYEFKKYKKAINHLKEAKGIYEGLNNKERILLAEVNLMLNSYFAGDKEWESLEQNIKDRVLSSESSDLKYDYYNYLAIIHKDLKDYEKGMFYLDKANEWIQIRAEEKTNQAIQTMQGDVKFRTLNYEIQELANEQENLISLNEETQEENEELQRRNLWILILSSVSVIFLLGLIYIFYRSSKVQKRLNQQLEEQNRLIQQKHEELINSSDYAVHMEKMLLQQMNPHFIFNALMTIEASLSMKEYDFAQKYIEKFTQLVRKTLDNSRAEVIPLQDEIEYLKSYISLYQTKLGQVFEYKFSYSEELVEDFVYTPPMLIQPFIENAILHGLMNKKEGPKTLEIEVEPLENTILWKIKDNGIGRDASAQQNAKKNVSHGSKITEDRIKWMENIYGSNFSINYIDLDQGTVVEITTPIVEK